ncbi:MAG: carboxypeptidase regulatory-like domain-containing protein [Flavobacteriales bacterium]|nr:carboxypeptidase regulatory-like domain-containing protein [Flavobacteriales bacterium]
MKSIKKSTQQGKVHVFIIFLIILFISTIHIAFGQCVQGTITDAESGDLIPFANILVTPSSKAPAVGAVSDFDGKYRAYPVSGKCNLSVSFVGYDSFEIKDLIVGQGDTVKKDIALKPSGNSIECVEIIGYNIPLIQKEQTMSCMTITRNDIARMPARRVAAAIRGARAANRRSKQPKAPLNLALATNFRNKKESKSVSTGLTAGEIKDFGKWELWNNMSKQELSAGKDQWGIDPQQRYSVRVRTADGFAAVDYRVQLVNQAGEMIFETRTNNTGSAELWGSLFDNEKVEAGIKVLDDSLLVWKQNAVLFKQGINHLTIRKQCAPPANVDLMFVVDATSSMSDEINHLKTELKGVLKGLDSEDLDIRCGSVFYRCFGNVYVTRTSEFSDEIGQTISFIQKQEAQQGGMEAVEEALDVAINKMAWSEQARARLLFLILDESPGTSVEIIARLHKSILDAAIKGIHIIPVVASGMGYDIDKKLEYLMRSFAIITNGSYVFLTDHSGIGGKHTAPSTDEYDVEMFKELLPRIISEHIYVASCEEPQTKKLEDTTVVIVKSVIEHVELNSDKGNNTEAEEVEDENPIDPDDERDEREAEEGSSFRFYPNPTSGQLTIELNGDIDVLYLADISGRLLQQIPVKNKNETHVDLSLYPKGMYFLQHHDGKKVASGKVVLAH